jgi:hypothetical protein
MTTHPLSDPAEMSVKEVDSSPIALLERISKDGRYWDDLAPCHGVTNPDPPWKTSLVATCDCLADRGALAALDRRLAEDQLSETIYRAAPAPERQLLAFVHTILIRGLIDENDLADRMKTVRARLDQI